MYGKQTQTAIAAMSRLAEIYDGGRTRLSASDIARDRGLQAPFVAKLMTALSQAGLVDGAPGPGGGYSLARPPGSIRLAEVFGLFEREDTSTTCPFGAGTCGGITPCPLHDKLVNLQRALDDLLQNTTFEEFHRRAAEGAAQPVMPTGVAPARRESFRAAAGPNQASR